MKRSKQAWQRSYVAYEKTISKHQYQRSAALCMAWYQRMTDNIISVDRSERTRGDNIITIVRHMITLLAFVLRLFAFCRHFVTLTAADDMMTYYRTSYAHQKRNVKTTWHRS